MPLPTINDVQGVETILTNMLVGYKQAEERFVASRVFPPVSVPNDSGTFFVFTKKYWFLDEMKVRTPGQQYARAGFGLSTDTYATLQWALATAIADETEANSQVPMSLESAAVEWLAQKSLLRKEIQFAADFMTTSVWGTDDNNSTTDWDDFSAGDPIADVKTAVRTISNNTGMKPNAMVMGFIVDDAISNHPDIIDRMKYVQVATQANIRAVLASVFGVEQYLVSEASYSNTNEAATFSASAIIDDDCLVTYIAPSPGLFKASGGYSFNWAPGGGMGVVLRNRDDLNDTDLIKTKEQWDQKAVATDLGYFFADVV
jgi:hypothetical protein